LRRHQRGARALAEAQDVLQQAVADLRMLAGAGLGHRQRALAGQAGDAAFLLQARKGRAHGAARHAEFARQFAFARQRYAHGVTAVAQALAQGLGDLLKQGLGRVCGARQDGLLAGHAMRPVR